MRIDTEKIDECFDMESVRQTLLSATHFRLTPRMTEQQRVGGGEERERGKERGEERNERAGEGEERVRRGVEDEWRGQEEIGRAHV